MGHLFHNVDVYVCIYDFIAHVLPNDFSFL